MIVRAAVMVVIALSVDGCASPRESGPNYFSGPVPARYRASYGHISNAASPAPDPMAAEDALLNTFDPRSAEWRIAYSKIEAEREKRLAAKLVICVGCLP